MRIERVLESCLYVDDLEAAEEFYSKVLGLEVHSRFPGRHVFFCSGDGMFLLFNPDLTSQPSGHVPTHGAHGPGHVAFAVKENRIRDWQVHLRKQGVVIKAEIDWPAGGHSLYFRDPAGNSVELATPQTWDVPES